jgi:membrane protease YdiL (CAAX protease family)
MSSAPTDLDFIAAILVLLILVVSGLTLFGMGILMAVGAVSSSRPLVTSWPAEQEHTFSPFERRGSASNSMAWTVSLIGGALVFFVATGVYFTVAPDKKDIAKDMNMSNLTKRHPVAAPKPDAPKPDATAPAEAPKPATPATPEAPKP